MTHTAHDTRRATSSASAVALVALPGAAVAVALGAYGRLHTPTGRPLETFVFESMMTLKVWLALAAAVLAAVQLTSALAMWGRIRLPLSAPVLRHTHRWSGTVAFLLTLPVAFHCLWALGFHTSTARKYAHSLAGCLFYGAFVTKLLCLRSRTLPARLLPIVGGVLLATLSTAVALSAGWYLSTFGLPAR